MFNNNISKPAKTVFLPLTSAIATGKNYFCQDVFSPEKNGFYQSVAKTCQPCLRDSV